MVICILRIRINISTSHFLKVKKQAPFLDNILCFFTTVCQFQASTMIPVPKSDVKRHSKYNFYFPKWSQHNRDVVQRHRRHPNSRQRRGRRELHHRLADDPLRDEHAGSDGAVGIAVGLRRQDLRNGLQLRDHGCRIALCSRQQ